MRRTKMQLGALTEDLPAAADQAAETTA